VSLWNENVVIRPIYWFYVKNCIFVHMTDGNFSATGALRRPLAP